MNSPTGSALCASLVLLLHAVRLSLSLNRKKGMASIASSLSVRGGGWPKQPRHAANRRWDMIVFKTMTLEQTGSNNPPLFDVRHRRKQKFSQPLKTSHKRRLSADLECRGEGAGERRGIQQRGGRGPGRAPPPGENGRKSVTSSSSRYHWLKHNLQTLCISMLPVYCLSTPCVPVYNMHMHDRYCAHVVDPRVQCFTRGRSALFPQKYQATSITCGQFADTEHSACTVPSLQALCTHTFTSVSSADPVQVVQGANVVDTVHTP